MIVLERYDDLAWKRSETKILAVETTTITWNGVTFELDLGDGNLQDVSKYMTELRSAGRVIKDETGELIPKKKKTKPGYNGRGRTENKELRAWVDSIGLTNRVHPDRLAYINGSGKYAYPEWLWKLYDAREDIQHGLGGDRPDGAAADAGDRRGKG